MKHTRWLFTIALVVRIVYLCNAETRLPILTEVSQKPVTAHLPILFEENRGQEDYRVKYVAHEGSLRVRFAPDSVNFLVPSTRQESLTLKFIGVRGSQIEAVDRQDAQVNYLIGSDPKHWHTHIQTFRRLKYRDLYPGIDVVFYGNAQDLEHDFTVAPGADPRSIVLEAEGAQQLSIDPSGDLVARVGSGELHLKKPVAYQVTSTGKHFVQTRYDLNGSRISLVVNSYDHALPLVVDPVLTYSTWIAGSGTDLVKGLAVDGGGNVYVSGTTTSVDFPVQGGHACSACNHNPDVFVAKLDPTGTRLVYSTYVGGSGNDQVFGLGVDSKGNAIIGGFTGSADFPLVNSYTTYSGATTTYGFVLSLSMDGSQFNYSTLLGQVEDFSDSPTSPMALAVESSGNAYLAGQTADASFPVTSGTLGGSIQPYPWTNLFLTKLDGQGNISYSTIIPASLPYTNYAYAVNDFRPYAVAIDSSGNAYIGGNAGPGLPSTPGTISTSFTGDPSNPSYVGFLVNVNANASAISFGTYLPYTNFVRAIALHSSGIFVAGMTDSPQFPATPGAFQPTMIQGQNCPNFI